MRKTTRCALIAWTVLGPGILSSFGQQSLDDARKSTGEAERALREAGDDLAAGRAEYQRSQEAATAARVKATSAFPAARRARMKVQQLEAALKNAQAKLDSDEFKKGREQLKKLEAGNRQLQASLKTLQTELAEINKQVTAARTGMQLANQKAKTLEVERTRKAVPIVAAQKQQAAASESLNKAKTDLVKELERTQKVARQLESKRQQANEAKRAVKTAESALLQLLEPAQVSAALKPATARIAELEKQVSAHEKESAAVLENSVQLIAVLSRAQSDLMRQEIAVSSPSHKNGVKELAQLSQAITDQKEVEADFRAKLQALETKADQRTLQIEKTQAKMAADLKQTQSLQQQQIAQQKLVATAQAQLNAANKQFDAANGNYTAANTQAADAEAKAQLLKKQVVELEAKASQLRRLRDQALGKLGIHLMNSPQPLPAGGGRLIRTVDFGNDVISSVNLGGPKDELAVGLFRDVVYTMDVFSDQRQQFTGPTGWVTAVSWSADRNKLAAASVDHKIYLWQFGKTDPVLILKGHTDWIRSLAFSPEGGRLVSGGDDRTVRIWNLSDGSLIGERKSEFELYAVSLSSDSTLAAAGAGETILIGKSDANPRLIQTGTREIFALGFSGDGKKLAGAGQDKVIRVWEAETGKELVQLRGHEGPIRSLAVHPVSPVVASGSADRTVRLWDYESGKLLRTLGEHQRWVNSVAFSRNGLRLASGGADSVVQVWDFTPIGRSAN